MGILASTQENGDIATMIFFGGKSGVTRALDCLTLKATIGECYQTDFNTSSYSYESDRDDAHYASCYMGQCSWRLLSPSTRHA